VKCHVLTLLCFSLSNARILLDNLEEIEPVRSRVLDFQARRLLMRNQIEGRISKPWRPSTRSALAATLLPKRLGPRGTDPDVAQDMLVLASMSVVGFSPLKKKKKQRKYCFASNAHPPLLAKRA
jgi:hypothetical protein